jgi:hypothetical protein
MISTQTQQLNHALKEWAVAVEALQEGKTIVLLRKGGIREVKKGFQVEYGKFWLYPTYEHQKPELLKPEYAARVTPVESGWHPETISISVCGEITEVIPMSDRARVEALQPYHIWNERMITERLGWQSDRPLLLVLLRAYYLPQPKIIAFDRLYGGCKSWIDLVEPIPTSTLVPVLSDTVYQQRVAEIIELVNG